ncbi:dynein axonemal assembly factor 6-like [Clavelina lepadiformis]|uniref:dynein axonemal assembly factor 6-like n=1 Tax=Clavelina lepadiformis TaxID=159417 RepID=UPI0040416BFA
MVDLGIDNAANLKNLAALLNPKDEDSSDDDMPDSGPSAYTPASIGPSAKKNVKQPETPYAKASRDTNDIWQEDEVQELSVFADDTDSRPKPNYDISYKQKVSTEDMFLGMGSKNPSSACCEDMIIRIELPGCSMKDVELDVKENYLDCRCPKYRLLLALPHPVDPKKGNAQWDGNKEVLNVTLTMSREYDFINFQ